jgi:hypothetical protein
MERCAMYLDFTQNGEVNSIHCKKGEIGGTKDGALIKSSDPVDFRMPSRRSGVVV